MMTAAGAALLYALALILLAVLHARDRRSPLHTAVSDYATGPQRGLFAAYGLAGTVAAGLLASAIWITPQMPRQAALWLAATVPVRLMLMAAPTDAPDRPATARGRVHLLLAIAGFALVYTAIRRTTPAALELAGPLAPGLALLGHVITAGLAMVVLILPIPGRRWFGLAERVFLIGTTLWLMTLALLLT